MYFLLIINFCIMKNSVFRLLIFLFAVAPAIAQPVSDNAVIPVSVTLNSILRLNVVKGGNITFKVNTIKQYQDGIPTSALLETRFTVASSVDFDVDLLAQDATFIGTDITAGTNTMPLDNVGYKVSEDGSGGDPANWAIQSTLIELTNAAQPIVTSVVGAGAGGADKNDFTIEWELATAGLIAINTTAKTLLAQSLKPDYYTTNVFLILSAH